MTIPARCPICLNPGVFEIPDESDDSLTANMARFSDGVLKAWCRACIQSDDKKLRERQRVANELDWHVICPKEYRLTRELGETDPDRLNTFRFECAEAATKRALLELGTRKPLLLFGVAGTMKTRMAWRIAREAFNQCIPVYGFTSWTFQAAAQNETGAFRQGRWVKRLANGFVLLDDITKTPWTDNTKAAFFELLEQVTSKHGLMVITSNLGKGEIAAFAGQSKTLPDADDPILRRLEEYFVRVLAVKGNQ